MRILIIGATGTIGREITAALSKGHELLLVSRKSTPVTVDLGDPTSIQAMYRSVGKVDAIVSAAGAAKFAPFGELSDSDFRFSLDNKLMGQVNLVRFGLDSVLDKGSFTLTSGVLARMAMTGSAAVSLVNAGLEGFTRSAALEAPRGIRVNIVSPPWVTETLKSLGMDPSKGLSAASVARSYVESVLGSQTGAVLEPSA
jgi:NAD(P)-dependent dehydrogenase (short-subunit alcohol dehydrogenase family)